MMGSNFSMLEIMQDEKLTWKIRLRRFRQKLTNLYWFFKYHLHPRHRYHMLDLREPWGPGAYRYGWRDADKAMELALWKLMVDFVEVEFFHLYKQGKNDTPLVALNRYIEELSKTPLAQDVPLYEDLRTVYLYYKKISLQENRMSSSYRRDSYDQDTEMLIRLIKIRNIMWT